MDNIVWVRDPQEGFILAKMSDLMEDGPEVVPLNTKFKKRNCPFEDIYPSGNHEKDVDDNCKNLKKYF